MNILLTGGAGYIGSHAAVVLTNAGHRVVILDNFSNSYRSILERLAKIVGKDIQCVEGDVRDTPYLEKVLKDYKIDAVMHFAGKSLVGESVEKPDLYHSVNVDGTRILLDEMHKQSITKIVFSSSAATYGEPKVVPILETSETIPTNPYGATKLAIDHMITAEAAAHGISAASLRYFNVAGALKAERGWLAERHNPETHLIPNVLRSTTDNPVKIFGTDWPTQDGTCIRDYVHVIDLIDAHLKALNSLGKPGHEIYNLGSGSGYSVREVVAAASAATGHQIPFIDSPRRAGDPAVLIADISKAMTHLGWEPTRDMNTMVSDTLKSMA